MRLTTVRALLRRRRRVIAAAAAALAVAFALASLQTPPPVPIAAAPALTSDEVAVPIVIDSPAIAATLLPGDVIDVFAVRDDGYAPLVAADARVLERPGVSGMGGPDAVVLIAVRESAGPSVATATGRLGIVIRQRAQVP